MTHPLAQQEWRPVDKISFAFICQGGHLEVSAAILAISLKQQMEIDFELVAIVPGPAELLPTPHPDTIDLLERLDVRIIYKNNPILCRPGVLNPAPPRVNQKLTNKILALDIDYKYRKLMVVDSGHVCIAPLAGNTRFNIPLNGLSAWKYDVKDYRGMWGDIYGVTEAPLPDIAWKPQGAGPIDDDYSPPSFNTSVFAIDTDIAKELAQAWRDCFCRILDSKLITHRPYFCEQISLMVAVNKLGIPYEFMEWDWIRVHFAEYKFNRPPETYDSQPELKSAVRSIIAAHPVLGDRIKNLQLPT